MSAALSVCIPTHDGRAAKFTDALRSVTAQLADLPEGAIEIVISDNGSRDATAAIAQQAQADLGAMVVYRRFETNQGFTANLLQSVEAASGTHCWLLGSDDAIAPGGLAKVLALLADDPGLTGITVNQVGAGPDLHVDPHAGAEDPRVLPPAGRTTYDDAQEILSELGLLQDFISTQIVHRERFGEAVRALGPEAIARGRDFPHLPIFIEMIERRPRWRWVPEPLLIHRLGRETLGAFADNLSDHALLCTTQRSDIWAERFGRRSPLYRRLMRVSWARQAGPVAIYFFKSFPEHSAAHSLRLLRGLAPRFWFVPGFWLGTLPVLLTPTPVLQAAGRIARRLRR